jgi:FAD/FMN-containing dehydrogenase
MQVVTAEGEVVTADETENRDLYWALRGGGGGFGAVTSFEFDLCELGPEVMGMAVFHRLDGARDLLGEVREYWDERPGGGDLRRHPVERAPGGSRSPRSCRVSRC